MAFSNDTSGLSDFLASFPQQVSPALNPSGSAPNTAPPVTPALTPETEARQQGQSNHDQMIQSGAVHMGGGKYIPQELFQALQQTVSPASQPGQGQPNLFANTQFGQNHSRAAGVISNLLLNAPNTIQEIAANRDPTGIQAARLNEQLRIQAENNRQRQQQAFEAPKQQADIDEARARGVLYGAQADYFGQKGPLAQQANEQKAQTASMLEEGRNSRNAATLAQRQKQADDLLDNHLQLRASQSADNRARLDATIENQYESHIDSMNAAYARDMAATKVDPITGKVVQALQGPDREARTAQHQADIDSEREHYQKYQEQRKVQDSVLGSSSNSSSGMVTVQIPGHPSAQIPKSNLSAFQAKYPNAIVTQ